MNHYFLYRYESTSIQNYILQTNRLREIKGGSALIERLPRLFDKALIALQASLNCTEPKNLIAAAGGGTARFEEKEAVLEFAKYWPMLLSQYVPGMQFVHTWIEVDFEEDKNRQIRKILQEKLDRERQYLQVSLPEAGPLAYRVPRSGLPASFYDKRSKITVSERGLKDLNMLAKQGAGDDTNKDPLWEKMCLQRGDETKDKFKGGLKAEDIKPIQDMTEMNASYVAVVHADGNDLGKALGTIDSYQELIDFSEVFEVDYRACSTAGAS